MEKDLNTGPDSMDLLLKQAFLKLDENQLSNHKLNDMLANTVLNNNETISVDVKKENELFAKINALSGKGFWATNKLWIGLSSLTLVSVLAVFTYWYFNDADNQNKLTQDETTHTELNDQIPETNIIPILRDTVMPKKEERVLESVATMTKNPVLQNAIDGSIPAASSSQSSSPEANNKTLSVEKDSKTTSDPDNIPTLTEDDKKQNKKRKEAMIKNIVKPKKGEWIKVSPARSDMTPEFYMCAVEITNIQYKTFLMDLVEQNRIEDYKLARVKNSLWKEIGIPGFENVYFYNKKYNDNAVVNIKPEGMKLYCEWLSELLNTSKQNKSGSKYHLRLPTEQEWKFACTSTEVPNPIYTNGLNIIINQRSCMLANYKPLPQNGETVSNPNYRCDDSTKFVTGNNKYCTNLNDSTLFYPVMVYAFNPSYRGFYCMAGNVSEVVKKENGQLRSIGGNWNSTATYLKVNAPDEFESRSLQNPFVGFRVLYTKE